MNNVGLSLNKGEFLSLLGPSGSGKTTLLRMLAGLLDVSSGNILVNNNELTNIPANKRNFGMVFQNYALFPHLTVFENVAYGLKARKVDKKIIKEKVETYLDLVGLGKLANRKPKELSGGQQQRVSLARAMIIEPDILLFDEPLSNLDARLKDQMLREIHRLHKELGFTAVYVTHDQNEALYLSDQIAVLNKGILEQFGSPREIIEKPKTSFVADFFGYTNKLNGHINNEGILNVGTLNVIPKDTAASFGDGIINIKPQDILISNPTETNKHRITDYRYLGSNTEITIEINGSNGQTLISMLPYLVSEEIFTNGYVGINIEPNRAHFFKDKGDVKI
ncbi:ABC transporter ATP-binding protein [Ureibacillus massiliensis]|uniref:ABC transporter ATP-binding protein n=1 Tax=Ureibacillus massiliensis TaxID=292806 RepID=UPI00068A4D09|nr:ABC transporter ATP-binding protein [Ureibacillus massiliensis]